MPIPRQGPVDFEAVRAELGESEADDVALCTSAKINRKAKYKPYRIDTFRDITDTDRTGMHVQLTAAEGGGTVKAPYGLVPRGFAANGGFGAMTMLPWLDKWANDCKPRAGVDWCRITDFAGYNQKAGSFIHDVKLYTSNPDNPAVPMGPAANGEPGRVYAGITVSPTDGGITLNDFPSLSGLYFTLLFGFSEGADPFASGAKVYGAQAGPVSDVTTAQVIKLVVNVNQEVYNSIANNTAGDPWNTMMVCLAPKLTFMTGSQEITSGIDFSKLVSLDMWGDGYTQVRFNTDIAHYQKPPVSAQRHVQASASPLDFYMSSPVYNSSHRTVSVEMTSQLPEITILESGTDYELSTVEIRVAVRMGDQYVFMSPLLSRSCSRKVSGSKVTLDYDRDPPETVSFNVPTSVPAGTYATKVALLVIASGIMYSNGTATACDITCGEDQDYLAEPWYENVGIFPDHALFTYTKSLGNITIS